MERLEQQFIADFAGKKGIVVPNAFLDPNFSAQLQEIGFELLGQENYEQYVDELNERYPDRHMVPFAKSLYDDDTAGFVKEDPASKGRSIVIIHDFASRGWESPVYFNSLTVWMASVETP